MLLAQQVAPENLAVARQARFAKNNHEVCGKAAYASLVRSLASPKVKNAFTPRTL